MPAAPTTFPLSPAELDYLHTSLSSHPPIRPDLRGPSDFRPLNAETGVLPAANGSAHVAFADGGEAVVGVRAEIEKTTATSSARLVTGEQMDVDVDVDMSGSDTPKKTRRARAEWVTLTLTIPGARDDDVGVAFLEETLREGLVAPSSSTYMTATTATAESSALQDTLPINSRWHFRLYVDVVLISPFSGMGATPLPLLSMAIYLALRDTRLPMLKSVGEEDPVFEDDWERSAWLFERAATGKGQWSASGVQIGPPITLLVIAVGENFIFDPSREELYVADAVVVVSVGVGDTTAANEGKISFRILALRTMDTAARDTMPGVPRDETMDVSQRGRVEGVWKPKVGGFKRAVLGKIVGAVVGEDGVAGEVMEGLEGFLTAERERDRAGV